MEKFSLMLARIGAGFRGGAASDDERRSAQSTPRLGRLHRTEAGPSSAARPYGSLGNMEPHRIHHVDGAGAGLDRSWDEERARGMALLQQSAERLKKKKKKKKKSPRTDKLPTSEQQLTRRLQEEQQLRRREKRAFAQLQQQYHRALSRQQQFRSEDAEVEHERVLRLDAERRLREATADFDTCRRRLQTTRHDLRRMEDSARNLLLCKSKYDALKQEKAKMTMVHESAMQKNRSQICTLEQDNHALLAEVQRLEDQCAKCQTCNKELSYRVCLKPNSEPEEKSRLLKERLRQLEAETSSLVLENESQRQTYERCLDDIANQVVQALLTQKGLREECSKLRVRVADLEEHNRQLSMLFTQRIRFASDSLLQQSSGAMKWASGGLLACKQAVSSGSQFSETCLSLQSMCSDYMQQDEVESLGRALPSSPPPWMRMGESPASSLGSIECSPDLSYRPKCADTDFTGSPKPSAISCQRINLSRGNSPARRSVSPRCITTRPMGITTSREGSPRRIRNNVRDGSPRRPWLATQLHPKDCFDSDSDSECPPASGGLSTVSLHELLERDALPDDFSAEEVEEIPSLHPARPSSLDLPSMRKQLSGSSPDSAMQHSFSSASSAGSDLPSHKAPRDDGYSSTSAASVSESRLKAFRIDLKCLSEEDSSPILLQRPTTLRRSASESRLVPTPPPSELTRRMSAGCLLWEVLSPIPTKNKVSEGSCPNPVKADHWGQSPSPLPDFHGGLRRASSSTNDAEDGSQHSADLDPDNDLEGVDLTDAEARADLLDRLVSCADSSDEEDEEMWSPEDFSGDMNGAIRINDRIRPSLNLGAFFHRYGDQEKSAVASFSFLDQEDSSSSELLRPPQDLDLCLLGSSPTDDPKDFNYRAPVPSNRTVEMLKEENRHDIKEKR